MDESSRLISTTLGLPEPPCMRPYAAARRLFLMGMKKGSAEAPFFLGACLRQAVAGSALFGLSVFFSG